MPAGNYQCLINNEKMENIELSAQSISSACHFGLLGRKFNNFTNLKWLLLWNELLNDHNCYPQWNPISIIPI